MQTIHHRPHHQGRAQHNLGTAWPWTRRVGTALLVALVVLPPAARSIRQSRRRSTGGSILRRASSSMWRLPAASGLHRQPDRGQSDRRAGCLVPRHRIDLDLGAAGARQGHARVRLRPGRAGLERRGAGAARCPPHARELHALLQNAGVAGPYVLVGHSLGGLSVRMYADQYPDEVAGMVLIEGTNPDAWQRLGSPKASASIRTNWRWRRSWHGWGSFASA